MSAPRKGSAFATPVVRYGDLLFTSGQLPRRNGQLMYVGKVGGDVGMEAARAAAMLSVQACLAVLEQELSGEGALFRIVKLTGYVASALGFGSQGLVIDAASEHLIEVLGERGKHARSAIGVAELPHGACVEIEVVAAIDRSVGAA